MSKPTLLCALLAMASLCLASDFSVVGKTGETLPVIDQTSTPTTSHSRSDVEYNTTGVMDAAATTGGSNLSWGSHFITAWSNQTGQNVHVEEFGWPCGGPGPMYWVVWLTSGEMPGLPGTWDFHGSWMAADDDGTTNPPPTYSYIDVSSDGIFVPAGMVMYFGYENPGIGGQISYNGTETWAWYQGAWDPDSGWERTAVLQFRGSGIVATEISSLSRIKALFR